MMSIAESIAARVQSMVRDAGSEGTAADADSASEATDGSPPSVDASGTESASADESTSGASSVSPSDAGSSSPEAPTIDEETRLRHQMLEEKLATIREERRRSREEADAAQRAREEAEADRKAAAEERARWEERKKKPWIDRIKDDGLSPAEVFEQMRVEAMKAGTPEAKIEALQAAYDAKIATLMDELKSFKESVTTREQEAEKAREEAVFASHFERAAAMPEFASLSKEYSRGQLRSIVEGLRANPDRVVEQAEALGRPDLTPPDGRINMGHIFAVLKATQEVHLAKMRDLVVPPEQAASVTAEAKTVNGTTDRRNAGSALGNTVASERATDAKPRTTRRERVQRLIRG